MLQSIQPTNQPTNQLNYTERENSWWIRIFFCVCSRHEPSKRVKRHDFRPNSDFYELHDKINVAGKKSKFATIRTTVSQKYAMETDFGDGIFRHEICRFLKRDWMMKKPWCLHTLNERNVFLFADLFNVKIDGWQMTRARFTSKLVGLTHGYKYAFVFNDNIRSVEVTSLSKWSCHIKLHQCYDRFIFLDYFPWS